MAKKRRRDKRQIAFYVLSVVIVISLAVGYVLAIVQPF